MRTLAGIAVSLFFVTPLFAQNPSTPPPAGEELVDRVVAVVGDTALLLSDVQAELQQLQASGQPVPSDPAGQEALFRQVLESRVNDLVLINAARNAGIVVLDAEVAEQVEQDVQQVQERFGSEAAFTAALAESGLTPEAYRQTLTQQKRDQLLTQRFIQGRLGSAPRPTVTDAEIQRFFETQRESLPPRPASVSFEQVILAAEPSDSARAAARAEAEQVLRELAEGTEFEVLARRYSDDPGSRESGGDLGWFRQGRMVPEFENAVYALRPGQTSSIVETDFGYHIIRLEKARGPERQARHILIRPEVTDADQARARTRADSVAVAIRGGAPVAELAERFDTPRAERQVERIPLDRLPPVYATALEGAQAGQIIGPFEMEGGPNETGLIVLRLTDRGEAGPATLADVRDRIEERLQEQQMLEQIVQELRQGTYVNVQI